MQNNSKINGKDLARQKLERIFFCVCGTRQKSLQFVKYMVGEFQNKMLSSAHLDKKTCRKSNQVVEGKRERES